MRPGPDPSQLRSSSGTAGGYGHLPPSPFQPPVTCLPWNEREPGLLALREALRRANIHLGRVFTRKSEPL